MRMKQRPFFGELNMGLLPDLWDKFSFQIKKIWHPAKPSCTPSSNQVAVHSQFGPKVDNQQNLNTSKTNHVIWKILGLEIAPQAVEIDHP